MPEPIAAPRCVMEAFYRQRSGTVIAFVGCDMADVNAILRSLRIRWHQMLAERAAENDDGEGAKP